MKWAIVMVLYLLCLSSGCFAMSFSQPTTVGKIFVTPSSGTVIRGASYNSGQPIDRFQGEKTYRNGLAAWGNGDTALFFHYGSYPPKFGSKNINNAYPVKTWVDCEIIKIGTDSNISLYMLRNSGSDISVIDFTLLGRRNDGVWVKYFDTNTLIENYFGANLNRKIRPIFSKFDVRNDTISMSYGYYSNGGVSRTGEFRFKWDDKAQWFSVEQVVY